MSRKVELELDEILSIVSCASDYGFEDDVLFDALAEWAGPVTDEEIAAYAKEVGAQDGYGKEDEEAVMHELTAWRNRFQKAMLDRLQRRDGQ